MKTFNVVELIERKRDGGTLGAEEIGWLMAGYTNGDVADYQMAAMAMAVFLNGLDDEELAAWTGAMLNSGEVLDLSGVERPKVDKHSTGGVGDKVSIPLAPIVAVCGVAVPMMSGRGLGHTGGTLDKLESIPGFTTQLDPERFRQILAACGFVMAGQSESLVPADRKLYALRDATGTVPSIPLIASSIMSKKLAEDLDGLVLDVKVGSGAFMTDIGRARELAATMVAIGASYDVDVRALITDMNQPLGRMVGNSNEIVESIDVLRGEGPSDLTEVTRALALEMLGVAGIEDGETLIDEAVTSGRALERFGEMVTAHGGDAAVIDDPSLLPQAPERLELLAPRSGFVVACDARRIGVAAMRLGSGRTRKEDSIDPGVGIELVAKVGAEVAEGDMVAVVTHQPGDVSEAVALAESAWTIGDEPPSPSPLIHERING
ncbi:MAG TPA: thymidine phosphorylase [Acidimicrobiia bacterium]|nr:thymidine phosphorylase [Acidimicrobiia bacterium]